MPFIDNVSVSHQPWQGRVYATDLNSLLAGIDDDGVISGLLVTPQGSPNTTVAVAAGLACINGAVVNVAAVSSLSCGSADTVNPRWDLVVVNGAGTVSVVNGVAGASAIKPAVPANSVLLADVYRPVNDNAIDSGNIIEKRVLVIPRLAARNAGAVTVVNTTTETDLCNDTIRAGLLGTTKMLRLTLFGDYLNNTAANQTFTLRVYFGGTTVFADASGNVATGTARRAWSLQVLIANLNANNSQFASMLWLMGVAGGATTGIGDLAAAGQREAAVASNGLLAINTANDQTLRVSIQHGAANAALEFRKLYCVTELV